jgi:hypothetical protein
MGDSLRGKMVMGNYRIKPLRRDGWFGGGVVVNAGLPFGKEGLAVSLATANPSTQAIECSVE